MEQINPQYFEEVVKTIKNGNTFETFVCDFLCQSLGVDFIPMGGIHDKGIDAALYCDKAENNGYKIIYQMSIDGSTAKIYSTIEKLQNNGIEFSELCFVTNEIISKQEDIRTFTNRKFHVLLNIYDLNWLRGQVNSTTGTMRVFSAFSDRYCHEFSSIGKTRIIEDFDGDPRIFIFLRQQLDNADSIDDLQVLVIDSMVIFALEGTDPDKKNFMSRNEIQKRIYDIAPVSFDEVVFERRLRILSTKPRKINHHRQEDLFCLPYSTRSEIQALNVHDESVVNEFESSLGARLTAEKLGPCFSSEDVSRDIVYIFNDIFKKSGLEFANFILHDGKANSLVQDLPSIIEKTLIKRHPSLDKARKKFLDNLLFSTIRELIYSPCAVEKQYLSALSKTYMTLFMLQADPQIAKYLKTMARGLEIFICSSILIPALSEIKAPEKDRRLWNLLKMANKAGVKFYINTSILDEIVRHIDNKIHEYQNNYEGNEFLYTSVEMISCIDSILIRGYFYHKLSDRSLTFWRYIDEFVNPSSNTSAKRYELREFFKDEFGIELFPREEELLNVVNEKDLQLLTDTLEQTKPSRHQAINDAKTILTIYTKRKIDHENMSGALGYRSWWLSTDTTTFAAVERCLGDSYSPSCYIRPDFLANFISLSPQARQIELAYDNIFPNTLGISLSRHIDGRFTRAIAECIKTHSNYKPARIKTIIHTEIDRLKSEFQQRGTRGLIRYIETLYNATSE